MRHEFAKILDLFRKLNYVLTKQQKQYGVMVLLCTMLAAVLEMLGVSAIMPVVEALTDSESLSEKWYLQPFISTFHITSTNVMIYIVYVGVILIYLLKNVYFTFYTWLVKKYTYKIKRELGTGIVESYMVQGYIFFVNNNSGKMLRGITSDVNDVNAIINNIFNLLTKLMTIVAIGLFILIREPLIALALLTSSAVCVVCIQIFYKKSMRKYAERCREATWNNNQACLEMIHGSKEVLVTGRQKYFRNRYVNSINQYNKNAIKIDMATTVPAFIIETICITGLLLAIMMQIASQGITSEMISSLSVIAVGAFRILPSFGAVTTELNAVRSGIPSFNAAYLTFKTMNELKQEWEEKKTPGISEKEKIAAGAKRLTVSHVYYKYPGTEQYILEDVNLEIAPKTSIGIIGASGAGKSTFVDVLLGLLEPVEGRVLLNDTDISLLGDSWNRSVGYVPQSVFLVDEDIRANIAFGIEKEMIDDEKVWRALEMAQLADFIRELPTGLDTIVGERGVKFSGGQRQRVAIARALYTNPDILVLDEATAALDNETENALMEAIDDLQGHKTLIVVAHRLTTIKNCDYIYEVKDGKLIARTKKEVLEN